MHVCTKSFKDCPSCRHYKFDPDRMDYACRRQDDHRNEASKSKTVKSKSINIVTV